VSGLIVSPISLSADQISYPYLITSDLIRKSISKGLGMGAGSKEKRVENKSGAIINDIS
jgi:hypothetical protein